MYPIQLFWRKTFVHLELALWNRYFRYVYVHAYIYMYIYCICKIGIRGTFPFLGSLFFKLAKLFALRDPHEGPLQALLEDWKHNEKWTNFLLLCNHTSWQSGQHPQYYCNEMQLLTRLSGCQSWQIVMEKIVMFPTKCALVYMLCIVHILEMWLKSASASYVTYLLSVSRIY